MLFNEDSISNSKPIPIFFNGFAALPADTFKLANEAFERGSISDAIQLYESIVSKDYGSASIYHNLGTAYIKQQDWSAARFYLEKGLQEAPLHSAIQKNLRFAREQIDDLYSFPRFPLTGVIETIKSHTGSNFLSVLLSSLFLILVVLLWFRPGNLAVWLYILGSFWIVTLVLLLFERNYDHTNHRMAIIWQNQTPLYDKPEVSDLGIANLSAGYKVRILEQVGPWYYIDLADGTSGWIEQKEVRRL
ncbi:MAG: tetratricopeptide repeat protein [Saprospiraceae bacterium]|nr:tetratricopeptide repeat protein [Saprospiraceae bacterium]